MVKSLTLLSGALALFAAAKATVVPVTELDVEKRDVMSKLYPNDNAYIYGTQKMNGSTTFFPTPMGDLISVGLPFE